MIHVVPVVILQFLRSKGDPRHFVGIVIRCVETVAVVNVEWRVRMSEING